MTGDTYTIVDIRRALEHKYAAEPDDQTPPWARGMGTRYIRDVIAGKRDPSAHLLHLLGFEKRIVYLKVRA